MNSILLSTQECGSQELLQLTEMLCREQDFQIIVWMYRKNDIKEVK